MSLARTTLLNGAATAARLAAALVSNKLLALYVGPAGFGVVGQFQSLMSIVLSAAGGVFSPGVTKLTAEHAGRPEHQLDILRSALTLGLIGGGVAGMLLLLLGPMLADRLLGDASLVGAIFWLATASAMLALNNVLLPALSGLKKVNVYVAASIAGSVLSAGSAALLVPRYGLYGGLIALPLGQALAGAVTLWLFQRARPTRWRDLVGRMRPDATRALGGFALMAATTAIVVPASQVAIREGLTQLGGADLAGLWQAMWKLSETHLMLLTTTLSLYFLPRFAEITDGSELRREVTRGYRFVVPLVIATALSIYLLRQPLTLLLFTPDFLPLAQALGWQLMGDVLKIASWVPAYTMISHSRTRLYIGTEVVFSILVAAACLIGASQFGLAGAGAGYAATYAIYWLVLHWQLGHLVRRLGHRNAPAASDR